MTINTKLIFSSNDDSKNQKFKTHYFTIKDSDRNKRYAAFLVFKLSGIL